MKKISLTFLMIAALLIAMVGCEKEEETPVTPPPSDNSDTGSNDLPACDGKQFTVGGVKFNMVEVAGGTFWMGAQSENPDGRNYDTVAIDEWESPVHKVTLSSYYIGQTEVTQALWKAVMGNTVQDQRDLANPDWYLPDDFVGPDYPMYYVNWDDIQTFLSKLSDKTGKRFVLPTEAQWEFAARGGNKSKGYTYSGSDDINAVGWYGGNSESKIHPVAKKAANELGIYDMTGNVCEWCSDWFDAHYYAVSPENNPQGPDSGEYHVMRSSHYSMNIMSRIDLCRNASRTYVNPESDFGDRNWSIGFRIVLLP